MDCATGGNNFKLTVKMEYIVIINAFQWHFFTQLLDSLRVCLHGCRGPQVGEVSRLGWVGRLSI